MLSNQFLQLLRPFVPTTGKSEQHFVEIFAVSEFRTAVSDYAGTKHKVLSYLASYSDVSEETAIRMLTNEVLIRQAHDVEKEAEQFQELIDNALAKDNEELLRQVQAAKAEAKVANERARHTEELLKAKDEELSRERERASLAQRQEAQSVARAEDLSAQTVSTIKQRDAEIAELSRRLVKHESIGRILLSLVVFGVGISAILFLPWYFSWLWLENHPRRPGLYGCSMLVVLAVAWAIADPKRRTFAVLGTVLLAAITVILQLV